MVGFLKRELSFVALTLAALLITTACGKKEQPVPAPLPVAPVGNTGGGFYGGGCGGVGGTLPLHQDGTPFYSNLNNNQLQLSLFYNSNYMADQIRANIVGSGMFSFPDINQMLGNGMGGYSPTTQFCVSSATVNGGMPTPGTFDRQRGTMSMMLQGIVTVPYTSPFGGFYPGGYQPQYTQELVNMSIGYECPAYLTNSRIQGCVSITVGTRGGQPMRYYAQ